MTKEKWKSMSCVILMLFGAALAIWLLAGPPKILGHWESICLIISGVLISMTGLAELLSDDKLPAKTKSVITAVLISLAFCTLAISKILGTPNAMGFGLGAFWALMPVSVWLPLIPDDKLPPKKKNEIRLIVLLVGFSLLLAGVIFDQVAPIFKK